MAPRKGLNTAGLGRRRHSTNARAGTRPSRPAVRHHRLPAAVPRRRAAHRSRTDRRHFGGAQLRPWRLGLVAVLGFGQSGHSKGAGEQPQPGRGDRLRRDRAHLRDHGAARRRRCHHLCPRSSAKTRSSRATGSWTPDSRISLGDEAGPQFGEVWEQMARFSFKTYRQYLGLPGTPVEWTDRYTLSDIPLEQARAEARRAEAPRRSRFRPNTTTASATSRRAPRYCREGATPFPVEYVARSKSMHVQYRRLRPHSDDRFLHRRRQFRAQANFMRPMI